MSIFAVLITYFLVRVREPEVEERKPGVTSVDESQSSLAGGILYMCQIAGGSIGLGLTTTVFSA